MCQLNTVVFVNLTNLAFPQETELAREEALELSRIFRGGRIDFRGGWIEWLFWG